MKLLSNTVTATHDHECRFLGVDGEAYVELDQYEADSWNEGGEIRDRVFNMLCRDLKSDGSPFQVLSWKAPDVVHANVPFLVTPDRVEPTPIAGPMERDARRDLDKGL